MIKAYLLKPILTDAIVRALCLPHEVTITLGQPELNVETGNYECIITHPELRKTENGDWQ